MDSQEEQEDQEEEKPFEVEADAECFESSQDLVHEIFRVDGGRKFAGFTNTSVLYSHTYEISYQAACEDSCFTCGAQVTFANRVKKDGKWIAVPGTGQDAIFFVFFALLVGALLAAEWRWRWRFPRVRRFLEALPKFPHTIAVMLMGGLCYAITYYVNMSNVSNAFSLWVSLNPPELLFYGFLPILLFDAAMRSQWFYLKRLLLIILTFAFVVVVCNTLIFGILIQHVVVPLAESVGSVGLSNPTEIGWTLSHGFTLGAVLGSTDPVSVISFMEQYNAPAVYSTIIGGESLFNDASAYILFNAFLLSGLESFPVPSPAEIAYEVLWAASIGTLIGCLSGLALTMILKSLHEQTELEVAFTVSFAFLSFWIAQETLNASGPVSVTVCGLWMSATGLSSVSGGAREKLLSFWQTLTFISNALLFFFAGVLTVSLLISEIDEVKLKAREVSAIGFFLAAVVPLPVIYAFQFLLRGFWILLLIPFMRRLDIKIDLKKAVFLNFAALRGAVNLAMVLIVAVMPRTELAVNVKFFLVLWATGFVLMTLFINAPVIPSMMKSAGLVGGSKLTQMMMKTARARLFRFTLETVKSLEHDPYLIDCDMSVLLRDIEESIRLDDEYLRGQKVEEKQLARCTTKLSKAQQAQTGLGHVYFFNAGDRLDLLMRHSYEFPKEEPSEEDSPKQEFDEYRNMVLNLKAAGIHTLGALSDTDARESPVEVTSPVAVRVKNWICWWNGDGDGESVAEACPVKEELRIKFLSALQRDFRSERMKGSITPADLQRMEELCDEASHTAMRHPISLLRVPTKGWKWTRRLRMRLALSTSLSLHKSLCKIMKAGSSWIDGHPDFLQELRTELGKIERFVKNVRVEDPDLLQEVATNRGKRQVDAAMNRFIKSLQNSGLITDTQAERLGGGSTYLRMSKRRWSMMDVLQGLVFFRLLSAPSQGLLRNMFVVQSMQRKESLPVEGNIVIIIHGVAVRVMESGRALVGRGHVLGCTSLLKGAYAYSEQVKIAVISKTELETFLQAEHGSYPARSEYYRAAAASVLDAKMREEADTTSTVASVIEEEAGGDIVQDIERVLKESKSHKIMDRCLHLLASLETTEVLILSEGDSIVQQSNIVLVTGRLEDCKQMGGELYKGTAVIFHKSRRYLCAAENNTVLVVYSPDT